MIYAFEDYELDTLLFELRKGRAVVAMERQVFDVLAYLVRHRDRLVSKEELLDEIWADRFVGVAALNSRVMAARKAIGDNGRDQRLVATVRSRGYRFIGNVTETAPIGQQTTAEPSPVRPAPNRAEQEIRFSSAPDGVRLACGVVGKGPPLVKAPNWLSHLEFEWRSPVWRHWIEELSRDHTYVRYDQRGCGLSDWEVNDVSWEAWVRDLESVVDAFDLDRFPLLGISQGGSVAIAYAVKHPERVSHLILYGTYATGWRNRLTNEGIEEEEAVITLMRKGWGRDNPAYRQLFASSFIPGATWEQMRWFNDLCRVSASPENAVRFRQVAGNVDVSDILASVQVPTLVLHAKGDLRVPFDQGRQLAAGIPGARLVPLDGANHILLEDEPAWPHFLREVRSFIGVSADEIPIHSQSFKTILFTDVEGSTALTEALGDKAARDLLRAHEAIVRESLDLHGGTEIKTIGDGFMVSFPSATRAVECAIAIQRGLEQRKGDVQLNVRIGINAGEPLAEGEDLYGSSVNKAARIAGEARGGQVLVSDVVGQLVAGRGFLLADRGSVNLRGFADPVGIAEVLWRQ